MSVFISKNEYLTDAEMTTNANYIYSYLRRLGWSKNAICAMLGNMESESTINPGIYENLDASSTSNGFGLVQWTPNTKYKTWADEQGFAYSDINGQLTRIVYELANGLQWIATDTYPMSFEAFHNSNYDVETLAQVFLYNYERPANLDQPNRSTQARKWYDRVAGDDPDEPSPEPNKPRKMSKLLFYYAAIKR